MTSRPLRALLDASAIVAFTRESIHVGEVIAEVAEEGRAVGLPVLCLGEAAHAVADLNRLHLLVHNPICTVINPVVPWDDLAWAYDSVGRLDAAVAALAAIDADCHVLTAVPGLYAGMPGGGPVIGI